jgi:large subunit ribosomal protein L20
MRTTKGATRTQAKKRLFKKAKGFVGGRRRLYRSAKETLVRAEAYAYRDRRVKKREFRRLWIIRLNAAVRERGIRYSQFIHALAEANITINRKMLSEMAIRDPLSFDAVVAAVKKFVGAAA